MAKVIKTYFADQVKLLVSDQFQPSYPNGGKLEWSEGAHKFSLMRVRIGSARD